MPIRARETKIKSEIKLLGKKHQGDDSRKRWVIGAGERR